MKITRLTLPIVTILALVILGIVRVNASARREMMADLIEENAIREVVQIYFDQRYSSRAVNQIKDIGGLTDGSPQAESFLKSETDKLEIEIHNAKLHFLGYTQYKFTLNFSDIWIDRDNQTATVSVTEGHDVVFEISEMIYKTEPLVSKMRNLEHSIVLNYTQIGWKIVSDNYEDNLWRMLRATNLSKEEVLRLIDETQDQAPTIATVQSLTSTCDLPADDSIHPYDRSGSISYAHQYAISPNPAYYYFPPPYGDCTNFVNQAIHHGSNAEEVGSNTYGWYYNTYIGNDYSASWVHVQYLYDFITQYNVWDKGPEGCETDQYNALPGDLVQFEWRDDQDTDWDHSVIIVQRGIGGYGYLYWVAGHSDDIDNYPLDSIIYQSRRFVGIDRIDGYFKVYIPLARKDSSGYLQNVMTDPYPAPMEPGGTEQPQAYPDPYLAP